MHTVVVTEENGYPYIVQAENSEDAIAKTRKYIERKVKDESGVPYDASGLKLDSWIPMFID